MPSPRTALLNSPPRDHSKSLDHRTGRAAAGIVGTPSAVVDNPSADPAGIPSGGGRSDSTPEERGSHIVGAVSCIGAAVSVGGSRSSLGWRQERDGRAGEGKASCRRRVGGHWSVCLTF